MDGAFKRFRSPVKNYKSAKSWHFAETNRNTTRSFFMFVVAAINLGDFINHPSVPHRPSLSSFDAAQVSLGDFYLYLFCNLILRSTSGIPCIPCQHLSENGTLNHRGGHHGSLSGIGKNQDTATPVVQEVERSPPLDGVELEEVKNNESFWRNRTWDSGPS